MTTTLTSDPVSTVLHGLLRAEQDGDAAAFAEVGEFPLDAAPAERAELLKNVYMSVSQTGGELLYLLARATGARTVVEYGTSFGVSTIYLASAVRDNGGGTVITTELQPGKAAAAQHSFDAAGLGDLIDLRIGDARDTLAQVPRPVDLVLLDGWPDLALPVLKILEPHLRAGTLILVDDVNLDFGGRDLHGALLDHLATCGHYRTLTLPIGDGIEACVRLSDGAKG
ncbi:O-methyltransferase [Mycolicibacterium smegmatis]|uniref:O-methyltransferase n=1 Tax=Mycolicibacterium smegmatis TaxID=1772 RepID=UPI0013036873|nr:class I SAM-dependent methyltransferase [Mycolicibacterium smegmatis]